MKRTLDLKSRLAFALDVPAEKVMETLQLFGGQVGWVKANRAFTTHGPALIEQVKEIGARLFLDLKNHDIPHTVEGYAQDYSTLGGIGMFNVHALGGSKMMRAAAQELERYFGESVHKPLLLAVTILTSHEQEDYAELGFTDSIRDGVLRLAGLAKKSGCDGVVCSPEETKMIKSELGEDFLVVNPGIRFEEEFGTAAMDDQKRVATPFNAIEDGADILVMGGSLLRGGLAAVERAYKDIARARKERFGDPFAEGCTGSYS
jgi:orotidine-5'-phosphate decarboxylase